MKFIQVAALAVLAMGASAATTTSLPALTSAAASESAAETSTDSESATETDTSATTAETGSTSTSGTVVSITASGSAATSAVSVPTLTSTSTDSNSYTIPTLIVPDTSKAPFMQTSSLPDGTVFIAVGAILGFFGFSLVMWRGLVAWSLHRSVRRAQDESLSDTKALHFRTPAAPFYKYADRDSTISLSGHANKNMKKANRQSTAAASSTSLFFSPTAGAAGAGLNNPGNRGSNYLPAGYYASGASAPGNSQTHIPIGGQNISMTNLSHGYSRARSVGPSPPDSPSMTPDRGNASSSTLHLNQGYSRSERAPSAYLEDLFDGESPPPVPGHGHTDRRSSGRF